MSSFDEYRKKMKEKYGGTSSKNETNESGGRRGGRSVTIDTDSKESKSTTKSFDDIRAEMNDKYGKEYSKESKDGWQKFLDDREASTRGKEDETFWEKIGRYLSGGTPDTSLPMGTTSQVINDLRVDESYKLPNSNWSYEQKYAFGELYLSDPVRAYAYAEEINKENDRAKEEEKIEDIQDSATDNFLSGAGHTLGAIATAPLGLADFLNDLAMANAGREIAPDGNISPFEYYQAVTEGISTHLNEKSGTLDERIPIIGGKGLGDVYGIGTSIAQSALSGKIFGSAGTLVSYFGQGAASGMDDALSRGASEEQAARLGAALGAFEGLAEAIGIGNLFKIGSSHTLKEVLKNVLRQAGEEGLEEGFTSVLDNIADAWIMKDKSNFNTLLNQYMEQGMSESEAKWKVFMDSIEGIAYDTLGGFVSGGVHAGVKTGYHTIKANRKASKTYGDGSSLVAEALEYASEESDLRTLAEKYSGKLEGGKSLSGGKINRLNNAIATEDKTRIRNAILKRLGELGETSEVDPVADALVKHVLGEKLSAKERNILNESKSGYVVEAELNRENIKSGGLGNDWASHIGTRRIHPESYNKELYDLAMQRAIEREASEKASVERTIAESESATKEKLKVSESGKTVYNNEDEVTIKGIVSTEGGLKVELDNGKTVSASDLSFSTTEEAQMYEMVARMEVTPDTANEIISTFKPTNVKQALQYLKYVPLAYEYGKIGYEAGLKHLKLPNQAKLMVYNRGRADAITKVKSQPKATYKNKASAKSSASTEKNGIIFEGGFTYDEASANELQKASMAGIEAIRKMSSLEVHVFESVVENGERVYYLNGEREPAPNGYFKHGNKIYIDFNAGAKGEGAMQYTMSHEVGHFIREWNEKGFKELGDFLIAEYGKKGVPVNALIEKQKDKIKARYERDGMALPSDAKLFDMAYEEMVCDAMSDMFADPKAYEKLAKLKQRDHSLWKKLGEAIKAVIDKLKTALGIYKTKGASVAEEALHVRGFAPDVYDKLQDLYIKAFVEADANYETSNGSKETVSEDVKASERDYSYKNYSASDYYANGEIYSYDFLTAQKDMISVELPRTGALADSKGKIDDTKVVSEGIKNALSEGVERDGKIYVGNAYTGRELRIDNSTIKHGLDGTYNRHLTNARIASVIGSVVKNAIPINGLKNTSEKAVGTYAMVSYCQDSQNRQFVAVVTVEQHTGNVDSFELYDVAHAVSGRQKNGSQVDTKSQGVYPIEATTISIAHLLEIVNSTHQSILSEDVLAHLGETRNPKGSYSDKVLFSDRDKTSYAPTFYSHMGKVIDDIRIEKMGAGGVVPYLKGKGVKDEEIKWSGIEAFLEGKKSVTKAELQEFVAGSQLRIEEEMSSSTTLVLDDGTTYKSAEDFKTAAYKLADENGIDHSRIEFENYDDEAYVALVDGDIDFPLLEAAIDDGGSRWSEYKLDGGTNYRELVFTLPNEWYSNDAMRVHWGRDAEGVLAHARIQDMTTADGKKMLFIEELQSDWHNEGHRSGYIDNQSEAEIDKLQSIADERYFAVEDYSTEMTGLAGEWETIEKTEKGAKLLREYRDAKDALDKAIKAWEKKVPDAPFRDTYHEYVLKRLLRMAAEEGYDSIGWTPADIQSKRWSEEYAEGYRIEYDQDIPKFLRKYGKKWGATVGKTTLDNQSALPTYVDDNNNEYRSAREWFESVMDSHGYSSGGHEVIQDGVTKRILSHSTGKLLDETLTESHGSDTVWSMDITDSMTESVLYEGQVMYSERVTDQKTLDFLENQEHITTYKSFVEIDGKLYSPMATKVKGDDGKYRLTNASEIGVWQQAEEKPDSIPKFHKSGYGYYVLKKDDGGTITAAYNPYEHSSNLVLNDQFESAYQRPNLVTVECVIPKSEMTSGYKAKFAKDSVGYLDWKSGTVAGKLKGNKRKVYLSRWLKPVRILSDAEVATMYKDILGTQISVPFNVVTPQLLTELEKVGVKIDHEGSPGYQYRQSKKATDADTKYSDRDDLNKAQSNLRKKYHIDPNDVIALANRYLDNYTGRTTKTKMRLQFLRATEHMAEIYTTSELDLLPEATKIAEAIASDIEQARTTGTDQDLVEIKRWLRSLHIQVPTFYKAEFERFGGIGEFRKRHMGKFILSKDGKQVDTIYPELQYLFGKGWFPDIDTVPDQLIRIAEVSDMSTEIDLADYDFDAAIEYTREEIISELGNLVANSINKQSNVHIDYRDSSAVSHRTLLANALESAAQSEIERNKLSQYKAKIALIESEQAKLDEIRAKAKELRFKRGRTPDETKMLRDLDAEATQIANRISTYDKQLLNLESTTALKNVLEREKAMLRRRLEQKSKESLKAHRERAAKTQRELMNRYQESREKAIEGRHKTEMRRSIIKLLKRMNKLFKGGKERNVKEGMKETVATALALGEVLFNNNISNKDIVNLGVESVTEKESKLLNEYRDILIRMESNNERIESIRRGEIKSDSFPYISELEAQNRKYEARIARLNKELSDLFIRERAKLNRTPVSTLIYNLALEYHSLQESKDEYIKRAYEPELFNKLIDLKKELDGVVAKDMNMHQLESVHKVFTMIEHSVRTANQFFRNGKFEDLQKSASAIMEEVEKLVDTKQISSEMAAKIKSYLWNELTPYYAFDKIGSQTLMTYLADLMRGQRTVARDVAEAKLFAEETRRKHNYSKWDLDKVYDFKLKDGRTFSTTLKHLLSVYAYSKRAQADAHMSVGGFFHNDKATFRKVKGILKMVRTDAIGYKVDADILAEIKTVLGDEKTSYVDEMLDYLTKIGEKGNEVTRIMWGVDIFTEKVYFPLKSKDDFLKKSTETAQAVSLKNDGMTKETIPGASNPIVLEAFDDVWANHVERMSLYHGLVVPLDNLNKVLHYGTWAGTDSMSVSTMLEGKFTSAVTDYLEQFINDLNGGVANKGAANPFASFFGKFKKTVVGASVSTIVQQPTAVIRAMAEIDTKYFVGKPNHKKISSKWDELKTYAPVAIIKEIGGFDAGGGKQVARWINSDALTGIDKVMNTVDEVSMKGAEIADVIGWVTIWEAVKRETKATTNLAIDSDEFLEKCGERFEEVITKTQVYDSTLSRSGFMRSKNDGVKMLTSFMGEPTLSINMLYNAVINAKRGGKGSKAKAARTIAFVYASIILAEALSSAIYALRDDDEDESYLEKYLQAFGSGVISDIVLAPITSLPGVKDIVSIFQGWDIERSDMAIFKDIKDAFDGLGSENKSTYRKIEDFAGAIAAAFGLPLKNVLRTGREIYNAVENSVDGISGGNAWDAFKEGVTGKDTAKHDSLYDAIVNGDESRLAILKNTYKDNSAYETAIRKALRENDPRIKEAAQADISGDVAKRVSITKAIIAEGHFSQDTVVASINAEISAIKRGEATVGEETEDNNEVTSMYKSSDINVAFDNGDDTLAHEIIDDLIDTKVANGKTAKEAKSSLRSSMTSYWKPLYKQAYQSGNISEMERIRRILYSSGLYGSANDVVKTTKEWLKD